MVGHNNERLVQINVIWIGKGKTCAQNIEAAHQEKLQPVYTDFMCLIAKYIKANPLNGMEYDECDDKAH